MLLRLNSKKDKKVTLQPFGDFAQIEGQMGQGDFLVTLKGKDSKKLSNEEVNKLFKGDVETKKVINTSLLFGSHKSAGTLPHKHNKKQHFSHRRIFGHKQIESSTK